MKQLAVTFVMFFMIIATVSAQNLQRGFNFQGVARDQAGAALASENIDVQISIYREGEAGSPVYTEVHGIDTDQYGVFQIVAGSVSPATFDDINFSDAKYFMKVEVRTGINPYETVNDIELLSVPYAKSADNGVPAGTVMPFCGPVGNVPFGYLVCDGTQVDRTTYPALYAAIGDSWGNGDGSTTFHLPDMRGMFMRGWDNGHGDDPDAGSRVASNAGGNTGDAVGTVQTDATKIPNAGFSTNTTGDHTHSYSKLDGGDNRFTSAGGSSDYLARQSSVGTGSAGAHSHTIIGGDNESRPKNVSVIYIIKY